MATKLLVFCFTIIFLVGSSSALNFSISSSSPVNIMENFSVSISADSSGNSNAYDVKISIIGGNSETISEIYDNEWRNPFRYIKSAFPSKSIFNIRAINTSSSASLCAQLRKTGSSNYDKVCIPISINTQNLSPQIISSNNQANTSNSEKKKKQVKDKNNSASLFTEQNSSNSQGNQSLSNLNSLSADSVQKKIILNPINKKENSYSLITKDERIRIGIVISFIFFSILALILVLVRRL